MKLAYVMSHYPAVSHAFVVREIAAVRERGIEVETLSIHRAETADLLAPADREAAATTFSVLPIGVGALLRTHAAAFVRSPRAYVSTLSLAQRTSPAGFRERLWHLFYFGESMVVLARCRARGIRHLHAQFADSATDAAMLASHYETVTSGDPTALTWSLAVHGPVEFYDVSRYALEAKLARASFAVAISDFGRSQLMRLTTEERWPHIHVVRCGVDFRVYEPSSRPADPEARTRILYVGRLIRGKGAGLLLDSVATLAGEGHDVSLTIVGDGPARDELNRRVAALDLGTRVRLAGAIGQGEMRELYGAADIFCLPSFAEGIPVVAMEAMAMELAVVTTRIMGIPELIEHEQGGLLVSPGRQDELTDALRRLVLSPELRRRLGATGRERVAAGFDVRNSARVLQSVLEAELGAGFSPPGG